MAESYLNQEEAFYAQRQPTDYIDWNKIGSDLSKTLSDEAKTRTELKDKLDKDARDAVNYLQTSPQGESKDANEWALELANNGSQYMLNLNKLLKSGQLSVKDYTIAVQNLKDGATDTFSMLKEYQDNYKQIMDRTKAGDNQLLELFTNSQIEGYGDFTKSQAYIDPSTGKISIAMKEKQIVDGKEVYVMSKNPNTTATVNSLRSQLKARYDKFNVDKATNDYVKSIGKEIQVLRDATGITSIEDITRREYVDKDTKKMIYNFKQAETNTINSMLANPLNRSSVLTDSKKFTDDGMQYSYTYDKAEAEKDPSKILLRLDPKLKIAIPDFESTENGRKQKEIATEWVREQARTKYDREVKFQERTPRAPTAAEIENRNKLKEEENATSMIGNLWGGTNEDVDVAAVAFRDYNPNIKRIRRTPSGVEVNINVNGKMEKRTIPFSKGGKILTQEQFIKEAAPLLAGIKDASAAISRGGYRKGAVFNPNAQSLAEVSQVKTEQGQTKTTDYTTFTTPIIEKTVPIVGSEEGGQTTTAAPGDNIFGK